MKSHWSPPVLAGPGSLRRGGDLEAGQRVMGVRSNVNDQKPLCRCWRSPLFTQFTKFRSMLTTGAAKLTQHSRLVRDSFAFAFPMRKQMPNLSTGIALTSPCTQLHFMTLWHHRSSPPAICVTLIVPMFIVQVIASPTLSQPHIIGAP